MSWDKNCYKSFSYQFFDTNGVIQAAGKIITAIEVGDIHSTIQEPRGYYNNII